MRSCLCCRATPAQPRQSGECVFTYVRTCFVLEIEHEFVNVVSFFIKGVASGVPALWTFLISHCVEEEDEDEEER